MYVLLKYGARGVAQVVAAEVPAEECDALLPVAC